MVKHTQARAKRRLLPWIVWAIAAPFFLFNYMNQVVPTAIAAEPLANPYMVLIRDPAVHADLKLTPEQQQQVQKLTDSLDGTLWEMRGKTLDKAHETLGQLIATADSELSTTFSNAQRSRFRQIILRAQGMNALQRPDVIAALELSDEQQANIRASIDTAKQELAENSRRKAEGEEETAIQSRNVAAQNRNEKRLLKVFTDAQRQEWNELIGEPFDITLLGNVRYKAPKIMAGNQWIHSQPLDLEALRGNVVVIHFMAYG